MLFNRKPDPAWRYVPKETARLARECVTLERSGVVPDRWTICVHGSAVLVKGDGATIRLMPMGRYTDTRYQNMRYAAKVFDRRSPDYEESPATFATAIRMASSMPAAFTAGLATLTPDRTD